MLGNGADAASFQGLPCPFACRLETWRIGQVICVGDDGVSCVAQWEEKSSLVQVIVR